MKKDLNPVRGTTDYLPAVASLRNNVKNFIVENYCKNGFNLIQTPILENLDLLLSSDGGDNLKLIYKTIKRGNSLDLTKENLTESDLVSEGLRYDLTVPLVRFYCNNKENLPNPFKAIQSDYVFRAERPQRGRSRQFIQCDVDIIGDESVNAEIEVLTVGLDTLNKLGFKNLKIKINDRRILNQLIAFCEFEEKDIMTVCVSLDKLDKIGMDGVEKELVEKGFNNGIVTNLINAIKTIKEQGISVLTNFGVDEKICSDVENIVSTINEICSDNIDALFEISIIRGQGYYTGTIYEVYTEGMRGAIAAGGRYDEMVGRWTGCPIPAVGFSIGFEPITILMQERNLSIGENKKLVLFYNKNEKYTDVLRKKSILQKNYEVSTFKIPKNTRSLLEKLKSCGFRYYNYFNEEEIKEIN